MSLTFVLPRFNILLIPAVFMCCTPVSVKEDTDPSILLDPTTVNSAYYLNAEFSDLAIDAVDPVTLPTSYTHTVKMYRKQTTAADCSSANPADDFNPATDLVDQFDFNTKGRLFRYKIKVRLPGTLTLGQYYKVKIELYANQVIGMPVTLTSSKIGCRQVQ